MGILHRACILGLSLSLSCGDSSVADGGAGGSGAGSPVGPGGPGNGGNGANGGGGGDADLAAGNISIADVWMNQGVGVRVVRDGVEVPVSDRPAPLITGRPMLLQATWTLSPAFEPRTLRAVLTLTAEGGEAATFEAVRMVSGPAVLGSLDGAFSWEVPAESVTPDTHFDIAIYDEAAEDSQPEEVSGHRYPEQGQAAVDAWDAKMELDYVVVPAANDCTPAPTFTEADKTSLEAYLFNVFPIQKLNITYHAPITVTGCEDGDALTQLSQLRATEGLGPQTYYQAVFLDNDQISGGYAWIVGAEPSADRVSWVAWWRHSEGDLWGGIDNAVHELGHNHGRDHTFEDANYEPASGAETGGREEWGYGLRGGNHPDWSKGDMRRFYPPTIGPEAGADAFGCAMSYDFPYWVSAYTYAAFAERIREVSALGAQSSVIDGESLHGRFQRDGSLHWLVLPGRATSGEPIAVARATDGPGAAEDLPVFAKYSGEGELGGVVIPLPEDLAAADVAQLSFTWSGREWAFRR